MGNTPEHLINATVGGCVILEVIGQGGMGVIYKARQKSLDRIVALKILAPHLANDINFVSRFQKEARAIARVNHPNILAVYDVGEDDNINYMIMELIDGQSLAELQTDRRGALPWEEATEFVRQAAQGLEAAQATGIIHRDIKPENLMVTKKGVIKVSDFGLAKDADSVNNTSIDAVMGTPAFMSPEQCDGKKVDARSDIYSLGGTFYRLVTGRLPFEAETAMSMMYRHKHEALIPPHEVVPMLPQGLSEAIVKMMAKKREHRFQTMTEVIDAIDAAKRPAAAPVPTQPTPYPAQPQQRRAVQVEQAPYNPPAPQVSPKTPPQMQQAPMGGGHESGAFNPNATGIISRHNTGRIPVSSAPSGGFGPNDSSQMNMPSGIVGLSPGAAVPDDGYTNVARGDEMMGRGERLNALKCYRMAMQAPTLDQATRSRVEQEIRKEVTSRRQAAEGMLRRGMLVEASREARIVTEVDPSDEAAKAMLKDIEQKLGQKRTLVNDIRTAIASSQFEKAIKVWDGTPSELRDESLGKQIEQLRNVVVPSTKLAEQGESFSKQGRLEEAISTFEDALKINPNCEPARMGLKDAETKVQRIEYMLKEGYQFSLDQSYDKAVEAWKPILNLRPGHPQAVKSIIDAYSAHGQYLRAQGDLEGAWQAYKGATETDPQNKTLKRAFEDITNLRDKEAALIDRAQDAMARNRTGEAIRYWKELQNLNPSNKRAESHITSLSRQRSKSFGLNVVMLALLVAAGYFGYQYWQEYQTLAKVNAALLDNNYKEAVTLLEGKSFLFQGGKELQLREQAIIGAEIQRAEHLQSEGKLSEAAKAFTEISVRTQALDADLSRQILLKGLLARARQSWLYGERALGEQKWDDAVSYFNEIKVSLAAHTGRDEKAALAERDAGQAVHFVQRVVRGLAEERGGRKKMALEEYQGAQKLIPVLKFTNCEAFLLERLQALKFNPQKFQELFDLGLGSLRQSPPDLAAAQKYFVEAEVYNPGDISGQWLKQFTADMASCDQEGMSLYATDNPVYRRDRRQWGRDQRSAAFCIDRYEYPNKSGSMPTVNVSWLDASTTCRNAGKRLCDSNRWTDACKGEDLGKLFTYGRTADKSICNNESTAPLASGAKALCRNALGVYDMSGNVAEWTNSPDVDAEAGAYGGSFKTPAGQSTCIDFTQHKKTQASPDIGFRCCKPLPTLDENSPQ